MATPTLGAVLTSSGVAALLIAGLGAYVKLDEQIAERPTPAEVRLTVQDLTVDKLTALDRRLEHIEHQLDVITARLDVPGQAPYNRR